MGRLLYVLFVILPIIDDLFCDVKANTVNPLYNGIRYNNKSRYTVNSVCTKISGSCIFSLTVPCYSSRKHTFLILVRIASPRRF